MDMNELVLTIVDQAVTITRQNADADALRRENATLRGRLAERDTPAAEPPAEGLGDAPGGPS